MKKAFLILAVIFIAAGVFAQSAAYTKYVKLAKDYEAKKQWAFALNAWYDALGCDDAPALKTEALNGYKKLSETIYDGNPGYGNYKVSALHDEWMKLLIDAEKLGNTIFTYELTLGKLEKQSGTSNYTAKIEFKESDRYLKTIGVIAKGCAFASDLTFYDNSRWGEAWPEWPLTPASLIGSAKEIPKNLAYNIDGVKIFEVPAEYAEKFFYRGSLSSSGIRFNAFAPYSSGLRVGLYDYKFNIVDNKGKELFKGKRWLLGDGDGITLTDIPADVAKLIDSGKAFLNPVAVYLQYGKYNPADDKGGRTFIKNFPEAQLDMSTAVIYCWNKTEDKIKKNFEEALFESKKGALTSYDFIPIKGKNFEIGKTEVTQKFYEAVMGSNPSYHKGENLPVEGTSWYDAIYFCNELSRLSGFTPVYSVNGETDVKKWNYTPHILADLKGRIDYNPYADGYRLPTLEEWMYAAKGGENYVYAGSSNIYEGSWNIYNSGGNTHPVAQKKPNGYGLYDMNGNVSEWVWDESPDESTFTGVQYNYTVSGAFHSRWAIDDVLAVISSSHGLYGESDVGLRPVRTINIKVEPLDAKKALKSYELSFLSDVGFEIGKTEVTQQLYEAVMGKNPSWIKGANLPVEYVSWYDAIYFCNEYSRLSGFTPVYSVNGETDVKKWNYIPHSGNAIEGEIVQINSADGYRLPTSEEWLYAAKGGQNYDYSGSYNLDEVGWYNKRDGLYSEKHPVAQKKPNGYGLYDMSGNVQEWVWTTSKQKNVYGGYWDKSEREVSYNESYDGASKNSGIGFRVIRLPDAGLKNTSASEINRIINSYKLAAIPGKEYEIGKTEITQALYKAVTGDNPSWWVKDELPVERVSWYDAIYFCNELSRLTGKTPVYSVNGESDVTKWNYIPNSGQSINATINQNMEVDGYRLPTRDEWYFAAKGGENYTYSGSNSLDEVGWYGENINKTHPVAQKKANGYGLYDMSGNVEECVWYKPDWDDEDEVLAKGGSVNTTASYLEVPAGPYDEVGDMVFDYFYGYENSTYRGFRLARNKDAKQSGLIAIPGKNYEIGKTEVTQAVYESVMGENPTYFKGKNIPVGNISYYDILYFCNEYSRLSGLTPVYAVDGKTDVKKWNYAPHKDEILKGKITMDEKANGYRLPTIEEWKYAAKGGENYIYSGSDAFMDVAWEKAMGGDLKTHPVAQKKANGYGLYDMSGNVEECVWCGGDGWNGYFLAYGGDADMHHGDYLKVINKAGDSGSYGLSNRYYEYQTSMYFGFRIARNKDAKQSGLIAIPGKNYEIGKTEVTQALYESVMRENPSYFKGENLPVENLSYYDMLYFCNEYSRLSGLTPVYAVDGKTDVKKWNYAPHKGEKLQGTITMNEKANGYRLPTLEEWHYAARGGQYFKYSGSDDHLEVAWNKEIIYSNAHPVAQKKANGYGLYDMSGNVQEWLCDTDGKRYTRGGAWNYPAEYSKVSNLYGENSANRKDGLGFRIVRNKIRKATVKPVEDTKTVEELAPAPDREAKPSELIAIPDKNFEIGKTEVTQAVYESVMGENPSYFKGENLPVELVSWYDMLYFCNEYSRLSGLTPVYAVDGNTDVRKWKYVPHKGESLKGTITMDEKANGYRLPTRAEWQYAAKGGENYKYSGSDNIDEVAWHYDNSNVKIHPVAQKKPNGYGLYDMSGNVMECVWDNREGFGKALGGNVSSNTIYFEVINLSLYTFDNLKCERYRGFRLARNKDGIEIGKTTVKPVEELAPAPDREAKPSELIAIPDKNFEIGKTEVTQAVYESVMGENPSKYKGENLPVDTLSFYDILYFCNEYSRLSGLTPVYAVDGETDVRKWKYTPHKGETLKGTITMDEKANGYRLPTRAEWEYAAKGGQNFTYSGSDNIDEVAWHRDNSDVKIHPVAQKKPNGYGLYDMSGNVEEWIWYSWSSYGAALGGNVTDDIRFLQMLGEVCVYDKFESKWYRGFRLAHNKDAKPNELIAITGASDREAKPNELIAISGKDFEIGKTEVTQALYESVMGENPSYFKGENLPVGSVSWYDAIYFCNEYSRLSGLTPVYAVDNKTDVKKWNYVPHKGAILKGKITMDKMANGYRLPLFEEWQYAAKGGEKYTYSGSENMDEVAWHWDNSDVLIHPVAQKKTNGYGLYDMSSNVMEWVWDNQYGREDDYGTALGGTVNTNTKFLEVKYLSSLTFDKSECAWFNGFRIARSKDGVEIGKREAKPSELIAIPGKNYEIGKTEVTQAVYESVMYENPSHFKGEDLPVESVSWYDILYFCNEYSRLSGLTPVYAVDGKTDVKEWNYAPHKGEIFFAEITMDKKANGYRLPTSEEWQYAAKGGQNFKCSGSDNVDEVAWHRDNSRGKTQPVAQKKPNGYGLYDMNGNVEECVWDSFYALGGAYTQIPKSIGIDSSTHHYKYDRFFDRGFRLARNKD